MAWLVDFPFWMIMFRLREFVILVRIPDTSNIFELCAT